MGACVSIPETCFDISGEKERRQGVGSEGRRMWLGKERRWLVLIGKTINQDGAQAWQNATR